ncbi:alpha-L-rhamnosidase-related protein [Pontibacter harenae]|uniref:alpha-L-rhamnosidase-related protein n=1 Tax=Pontibacter harenae TaxID=2894083 RepID=UPI001E5472D9|nr:trehalase family glycosidase [Pontibacter harenae]MCC9166866.1 glycogen debranching protein [Pontibacter harenae]
MKNRSLQAGFFLSALVLGSCQTQKTTAPEAAIWQSEQYSIYPDRVVQEQFEAKALSSTEMVSNYRSMANEFQSPRLNFKFSINGKDNEMPSGKDHVFSCLATDSGCETPLIKFGEQYVDDTVVLADTYLAPNSELKVRLDMRHVLEAFEKQGFYTTFNGDKIYMQDFKSVFIAGGTSPMTWDFDNLANYSELELKDPDGDGIYEALLVLNAPEKAKSTATSWKLTKDISAFPTFTSDYPLMDALYNMALEEMEADVEVDSTFRTGKEWAGVWTRDISYSIILGMATLQPKVSQYSLMRKVQNGRIVQDTGTGGAYPVSTDRIVWAVAAWEIYKVTGDQAWLKQAYEIIRSTVEDDLKNAHDPVTGMVKGESSFLDWREQTYPDWMQPVDIYESECLGTSAVHYQANVILAEMAQILNDTEASARYNKIANRIREGINEYLWQPEKGYYGQYLYGRNYKILSPKSEALGEALSVLYGVADEERGKAVVANAPVSDFGVPSIFPHIPNIPPYHNNGVWPFVQAFWSMAAAKAGNEQALAESMAALYRPAALFLTNKENFVASNGDFAGTEINSDRQLWSVAGNLAMVYKVLFGMEFQPDKLVFKPFVPEVYAGVRRLSNFKYRKAVLAIDMEGFGNKIESIDMDGKPLPNAEIPADLEGRHEIKILLSNQKPQQQNINKVGFTVSPIIPLVNLSGNTFSWEKVENAVKYKVLENGKLVATTEGTSVKTKADGYAAYQVIAVDENGVESFASEPLIENTNYVQVYEVEKVVPKAALPYKGFSGDGFVEITKQKNQTVQLVVEVTAAGLYAIDFRYANGNGPINTQNKCAIRTLQVNNSFVGTVVLPQRGTDEWSDWGYTNAVQVQLQKGKQQVQLTFEPDNENMNVEVNQAMLDHLRITQLAQQYSLMN